MEQVNIVTLADSGLDEEWDAYVRSVPQSSMYYQLCWRDIIIKSFGHRSHYLIARENGKTRGVLPLFEMHSLLFGHFLVSLPFLNYGGPLADTPEHEAALLLAAATRAQRIGARHIELRQSSHPNGVLEPDWSVREHKAALVIPLKDSSEDHWSALSSRLRGKIRKSENSGATFSVGAGDLDDFFHVFSLNMRDLGTPVHDISFFRNIVDMTGYAQILLVHREGKPVAAALALRHGDRIELPWICSDYSEKGFNVNELLYWKAIKWACESGARELDLGRSSIGAGTYRFKTQWNPEIRQLYWLYWLASGDKHPDINPNNPKFELAIRLWKKLPLPVANRIGPWLIRNIP